ncbi:endonuclease/exonuclease/phosphatase family protein [Winogradskyella forsetii]|uniref:endonuclease/exonuclease/phosphatase family protein n=1 Tax=Winogradskyella forsetii TaxID=2686077 RepID=UPI0015B917B2|nr:endonuclease/exonuclease/phosphatase family protein [Winogradskyella forsetii]
MKKKILGFFTLICLVFFHVSAQETVKVMFYNLLNYPLEDAVPNRIDDLSFILNDYQPDLFLVCELNNISGAIDVLNTAKSVISSNFEMATYVSNTSDDNFGDQNDLQNLLYYNSSKFTLEEEIIVPTYLRDFNVYRVQLNTINQISDPIEIYIIIGHLKASSGTSNAQKRFEMIQDLETYLDTLPTNTNVLFGGDLNVYTNSEDAFQTLISSSNSITFVDPANRVGSWHNNPNYVDVFTQSTRTQNGFGGSTGGFDDRFDFILTSENMTSASNVTYVPNSYKVYGNNGLASCWNKSINSSDCETTDSQFSYELRNALHNFSDHLPVTVSLETDATFLSIEDVDPLYVMHLETTVIHQNLTLNIDHFDLYNERLNIYNNLGQNVKTFQLNSDHKQDFNVSDLNNGLYYLNVSNTLSNPIKFIIAN